MNTKNNIHLEGLVIDCTVEKTKSSEKSYANVVLCTMRSVNGNKEKSFHYTRFPVSDGLKDKILGIAGDCSANFEGKALASHVMAVDGELRNDLKGQPFIFARPEDVSFPEKISRKGNSIKAEATIKKVVNTTPIASTLIVEMPSDHEGRKTTIPVMVEAKKNPAVWAALTAGELKEEDTVTITGKLDGRLFGHGQDLMLRAAIISDTVRMNKKQKKDITRGTHKM